MSFDLIRRNLEQITCADGFKMSVQASHGHYCSPRSDDGPYTKVEVGFPSEAEPLLKAWAEASGRTYVSPSEPLGFSTIYPYVPASVVLAIIAKHGGRISGGHPPLLITTQD